MAAFHKFREEVVKLRTGKVTRQWNNLLDKWGAKKKGHTLAAKHLQQHYHLSPWWAQAVVIRWEYDRSLKK